VIGRSHRREPHAAVAGDHGGDAVVGRRLQPVVPRRLAVVVGVDVDETRRDECAGRVDLATPAAVDLADLDDAIAADRHVGGALWRARTVDHGPAANHEVERHRYILTHVK
jgi:hypothetical protein